MNSFFIRIISIVTIILGGVFFQTCTKPIDFDQIDEAYFQPSYLISLIYLELRPSDFLDPFNDEISNRSDAIEVDIPRDEESVLDKIEFRLETTNSIERNFVFHVIFFNELSEPIYILKPEVTIPASSSEITTFLEIPKEDINIIYLTKYIGFNFEIQSNSENHLLDEDINAQLNLKSSVILHYTFNL